MGPSQRALCLLQIPRPEEDTELEEAFVHERSGAGRRSPLRGRGGTKAGRREGIWVGWGRSEGVLSGRREQQVVLCFMKYSTRL